MEILIAANSEPGVPTNTKDHLLLPQLYHVLGSTHAKFGLFSEALRHFRKAVDVIHSFGIADLDRMPKVLQYAKVNIGVMLQNISGVHSKVASGTVAAAAGGGGGGGGGEATEAATTAAPPVAIQISGGGGGGGADPAFSAMEGAASAHHVAAAGVATAVAAVDVNALPKTALVLMQKYAGNVAKDPTNPKFRQIRLGNEKFAAMVWAYEAAQLLLIAAGWSLRIKDGFLVLPLEVLDCGALIKRIDKALEELELYD